MRKKWKVIDSNWEIDRKKRGRQKAKVRRSRLAGKRGREEGALERTEKVGRKAVDEIIIRKRVVQVDREKGMERQREKENKWEKKEGLKCERYMYVCRSL